MPGTSKEDPMATTSHLRVTGNPAADSILNAARRRIEVTPDELTEARSRRSDIASALRGEFTGGRVYVNGSVAHGDANTPLSDIDLGIVVPDPDQAFGPGKRGPGDLQDRAAAAIRAGLHDKYDSLAVEHKNNKRAILVRFREPVGRAKDFTADVIVAIDNPNGAGLYIPRYHMWDRSHPEKHTELIVDANRWTNSTFARTVRLVKHWNKSNGRPLCSWHIKALALGVIDRPMSISDGVLEWFEYAERELRKAPTLDPAHVAEKPIKAVADLDVVIGKVAYSAVQLREAFALASEGACHLAQEKLGKWMNDPAVLPTPDKSLAVAEGIKRLGGPAGAAASTLVTGVGAGPAAARPRANSWGYS